MFSDFICSESKITEELDQTSMHYILPTFTVFKILFFCNCKIKVLTQYLDLIVKGTVDVISSDPL